MSIVIPSRFLKKINSDTELVSTLVVVAEVDKLLSRDPFFFPEYTNHKTLHIQHVLNLADKFIPDNKIQKLSSTAVSYLILTICLHDIGMFITPNGLVYLLKDMRWQKLWQDYDKMAHRFSQRELFAIYGKAEGCDVNYYTSPAPPKNDMIEKDRLTYGDFLRRHHGLLAEYIAINGFPTGDNSAEDLLDPIWCNYPTNHKEKSIRKTIGLLAKSHMMSLREAEEEYKDKKTPTISSIPYKYIMVLLRLADLLDAGSDRAPHIVRNTLGFASPLSEGEWAWNGAIDSDDYVYEEKKKYIRVDAHPDHPRDFLKIKSWLQQIQNELDLSWAVLFEDGDWDLSFHRVESNILSAPDGFDEHYYTKESFIRVNPDIVRLLIGPLYSEDPVYGVRELLQNAIDACNEQKELAKRGAEEYEAKIEIKIDTVKQTFTITDNGIGMDGDVIANYFLTVGSSFRNSDFWKNKFIEDGVDFTVVRSGRFGVGVLAGFLLGNKLEVKTRKEDDKHGYTFEVGLDDLDVNIYRCDTEKAGTEIVIHMKTGLDEFWKGNNAKWKVQWNELYQFREPRVTYYVDGKEAKSEDFIDLPTEREKQDGWKHLAIDNNCSAEFAFDVDLRKTKSDRSKTPKWLRGVFVNGIFVESKIHIPSISEKNQILSNHMFYISFTDKSSILSMNLSRTTVYYIPQFQPIVDAMWKKIFSHLLKEVNVDSYIEISSFRTRFSSQEVFTPHSVKSIDELMEFYGVVRLGSKYAPLNTYFAQRLGISSIIYIFYSYNIYSLFDFWHNLTNFCISHENEPCVIVGINTDGIYSYEWDRIIDNCLETLCEPWDNATLEVNSALIFPYDILDNKELSIGNQPFECKAFHLEVKLREGLVEHSDLNPLFLEIFGEAEDFWIPFDMDERKKKFAKAFEKLAD